MENIIEINKSWEHLLEIRGKIVKGKEAVDLNYFKELLKSTYYCLRKMDRVVINIKNEEEIDMDAIYDYASMYDSYYKLLCLASTFAAPCYQDKSENKIFTAIGLIITDIIGDNNCFMDENMVSCCYIMKGDAYFYRYKIEEGDFSEYIGLASILKR